MKDLIAHIEGINAKSKEEMDKTQLRSLDWYDYH